MPRRKFNVAFWIHRDPLSSAPARREARLASELTLAYKTSIVPDTIFCTPVRFAVRTATLELTRCEAAVSMRWRIDANHLSLCGTRPDISIRAYFLPLGRF